MPANDRLIVTIFGQNIGTAYDWSEWTDNGLSFSNFVPNEAGRAMFEGQLTGRHSAATWDIALDPWEHKYMLQRFNIEGDLQEEIDLILNRNAI